MKTAHTKNNAASNAHSPKHFFSKNGEGSPFFQLKEAEEPFFSPSVIQSKAPIWQPKGQLSSIKRESTALQRKITGAGQRISHNSYTTFQIPLDKGLKFNIQFYKEPNNSQGALLKFKVHQDQRAPRETPIPAGTTFSPRIVRRSEQSVSFNFDSGNKIHLTVFIADRWKKESHDAINPTRPWGPLLMDKEFERRFVDASIAHVGGSEQYSWQEALPDEAVSPPIWQMYLHGGRLPGYRAIRGKYARRVLLFGTDIRPGERAAVRGFEAGAIISAKFIGSLLIYSIPYVGPAVMIGEAIAGRSIWGDKLSTEGRVLLGLLALIPVVRSLRSATASARAEAVAERRDLTTGISASNPSKTLPSVLSLSPQMDLPAIASPIITAGPTYGMLYMSNEPINLALIIAPASNPLTAALSPGRISVPKSKTLLAYFPRIALYPGSLPPCKYICQIGGLTASSGNASCQLYCSLPPT